MKHFIIYSILFFTVLSCAVVKPPQGGPKDETPPNVLYQTPENNALNFSSNQLVYTFDEDIEIQNWTQEVYISPYIDPKDVKPVVKGKKLFVTLPINLQSNTTYSISFGMSIVDLTEKNPITNFRTIFSTGSTLDSLQLIGKITNINVVPANQNLLVGLYILHDSISPTKDKPIYYTKTNADTFQLNKLPNFEYQLFCFNDKNSNTLYDPLTEKIAFVNRVNTQQSDSIYLTLFQEDFRKFQFSRPIYSNNFVEITFTKGLASIESNLNHLYNEKDKSLRFYDLPSNNEISFRVSDSTSQIIDTSFIVQASSAKFIDSLFTITNVTNYTKTKDYNGLIFTTPHLIENIVWDSVLLVLNHDTIKHTDPRISIEFSPLSNEIKIKSNNIKDTLYTQFAKHAINARSAHYNQIFSSTYYPKDLSKVGSISGNIETKEKNYILYLYNKSNVLIAKEFNPKTFIFSNLTPDTYRIEILIDSNNNQTYDTGKLETRTQAETIILYSKPILVKPNWDMGNINISF